MSVSSTAKETRRSLARKIRRERALERQLLRIGRDYINLWREAQAVGLYPHKHIHEEKLRMTLVDHFAQTAADMLGTQIGPGATLEDVLPGRAFFWSEEARKQAAMLLASVDRDVDALRTRMDAKSSNLFKPSPTIGTRFTVVWNALLNRFKARTKSASNLLTNGIAEEARAEAYKQVAGARPIYKLWVSQEDDRVRPSHVAMHGTMARIDENFRVGDGGWLMKQPGDATLGAPLKERINCRCWVRYYERIDNMMEPEERGTYRELGLETPSVPVRRKPTSDTYRQGLNRNTRPTSMFTFTGRPSRGAINLATGERATFTAGPGGITIRVGGRPIASASLIRQPDGTYWVARVTVDPRYQLSGVETLIRQSVQGTNLLLQGTPR
jgi:hypothetical protein